MPTDEELHGHLKRLGYDAFRPGQLEIVRLALSATPTLAVMPTGAGKSLCYQLPALVLGGLTVVVSPLVALMKDQVDRLSGRGLEAAFLNSTQREKERMEVERRLSDGRPRVLFVSPERFRHPAFLRLLKEARPRLVAVDEAHCVSEWGDTFRPDYALLGEALEALECPRLLALTATAAPDVRADIVRALRLKAPVVKVAGFDRPNLHLEVHRLSNEAERLDTTRLAVGAHSPAIVYTSTRREAERIARHLVLCGVKAAPYHAGFSDSDRAFTQDAFKQGELQVVCATNAFGLGIDKANVRLVLHASLPRSLDAFWQEAGRAGRDSSPAIAAMLPLPQDLVVRRRLLAMSTPSLSTVTRLLKNLEKAKGPLALESLGVAKWEATSALAFLESIGVVQRRWAPTALSLRLSPRVSAESESGASRLHRLLGGRRGEIALEAACRGLGLETTRELTRYLAELEQKGELRMQRAPPSSVWSLAPGEPFTSEHRQQLARRSAREQARLEAVRRLSEQRSCRRRTVLAAFGETLARGPCGGCDVCAGPRLETVRSTRSWLPRLWRPSPRAATVPGPRSTHT